MELERKYCALSGDVTVTDGSLIEGYASLFGACDQGATWWRQVHMGLRSRRSPPGIVA